MKRAPIMFSILCASARQSLLFSTRKWFAGDGLVKFLVTDIAAFDPSHPDPFDRAS